MVMAHNMKNPARRMRKAGNKRNGGYKLAPMSRYSVSNAPGIGFLNPHLYVTLTYSETIQFSNATLVGSQQIFNLNSIYDPNRTGGGHQPYGFDTLITLYNRYRVLKTSWSFEFGPTATNGVYANVVPVNGSLLTPVTTAGTFETSAEVPFARPFMVPNAGATVTISGSMALNKLNGCTITEYLGDDRFEAQIGASPAEVMTIYITTYNPNTATAAHSVMCTLHYEVDFHDPVLLGGS